MARRAYEGMKLDEMFSRKGWRGELDTFYRQRKSVWFVLALMIAMSAFWTNVWAWVAFFAILALYSTGVGVRMGMIVGISFCIWFLEGIEAAHLPAAMQPGHWIYRAVGLWCISTLFLLVVWKADGVHQLRLHKEAGTRDQGGVP